MGGDVGPKVTIPASLDALKKYPNLRIILVGDQIQIENEFRQGRASVEGAMTKRRH